MSTLFKIVLLAIGLLLAITTIAGALPETYPFTPVEHLTVEESIVKYATVYAVPEKYLRQTMKCESGLRHNNVYGDQGRAYGIAQYHSPTFDRYSALMGIQLDYKSRDDQIKLMAWQFANMPKSRNEWTCYRNIFGVYSSGILIK